MERQRSARSDITGFEIRRFSNGDLRPAASQVNRKCVEYDVEALNVDQSSNIHRSMAVASHGLIRLLLAPFCSFAERSHFSRIAPKHCLPQAYGYFHEGKLTFASGEVQEGVRDDDGRLHGPGTMTFADGEEQKGDFVHGCLNGQGKKTWANGKCEEGVYDGGLLNGQGKLTLANG